MNIEEQYFTCKKCGESKIWGEFKKDKTCKIGVTSTCKKCAYKEHMRRMGADTKKLEKNREDNRASRKRTYPKHRHKIIKKTRDYYLANRENILHKWRVSGEDKRESNRVRAAIYYKVNWSEVTAKSRKNIEACSDAYVKDRLRRRGFTREQINQNPELINILRIIIQTKRLCKT